jgi:hypothetical protein
VNAAFPALPTGSTSLPGPRPCFYATYASELTTAGNLVEAAPLPFNLLVEPPPHLRVCDGHPPGEPHPCLPPGHERHVFPGTYFPPPINLALHGHTHDYQAIDFQTGTLPDGGTFQPAATLVSGNAGDILDLALPYPLPPDSSVRQQPIAVEVATVSGVQAVRLVGQRPALPESHFRRCRRRRRHPDRQRLSATWCCSSMAGGTPATWTSTEYRTDNTVRDVCTIQTSGQMSCASWGIILARRRRRVLIGV